VDDVKVWLDEINVEDGYLTSEDIAKISPMGSDGLEKILSCLECGSLDGKDTSKALLSALSLTLYHNPRESCKTVSAAVDYCESETQDVRDAAVSVLAGLLMMHWEYPRIYSLEANSVSRANSAMNRALDRGLSDAQRITLNQLRDRYPNI